MCNVSELKKKNGPYGAVTSLIELSFFEIIIEDVLYGDCTDFFSSIGTTCTARSVEGYFPFYFLLTKKYRKQIP